MQTDKESFLFIATSDAASLSHLKENWKKSLSAPQDGMWEALTGYAQHWEIQYKNQSVGYACVKDQNWLLQFFVLPEWLHQGEVIFQEFIQQQKIEKALIGTNNPLCLSIAMHHQKSTQIHTYLFSDFIKTRSIEREGRLKKAESSDLERLVEFCYQSMGAPKEWLTGYVNGLIQKGEIFAFEKGNEILGTCEVRKSESDHQIADIGMVVSPFHRRQGLGTFLLGKAKEIALEWNRSPICSCEKDNIGSLKSIQKNGFRSIHQMLLLEF